MSVNVRRAAVLPKFNDSAYFGLRIKILLKLSITGQIFMLKMHIDAIVDIS